MSVIRTALATGVIVYIFLIVWQVALVLSVQGQALIAALLLIAAGALTFARNEVAIKHNEMIVLWVCVLLFGAYALARAGGLVW